MVFTPRKPQIMDRKLYIFTYASFESLIVPVFDKAIKRITNNGQAQKIHVIFMRIQRLSHQNL